ncbi:hypothetical protein RJ639_038464 [Escallonia herrerae]|uniref:Integrase catalytic domain-containing protein n=1 Tax=Escallonia herrerae TaxID=1293975 RepID=A0AA88WS58_9ASTE|nr:hypothetical protein RJ639_038464 [Escallonia herrerae]
MAVIHAMQQSIKRLQAAIENSPLRPEPSRAPGTSKTPEQTSHNQHATQTDDEESYGERRHPRSRRNEENYSEAYSTRNTYANTGGNRAERYSNAPIIIGRPFTEEIDLFPTPPHFKMPPCESYDGTGDPMENLARFTSRINPHLVPDQIACLAFPATLKGAAHLWFLHLAPRSISCWAQLAEFFRSNFLTSRVQRKNSSALFPIIQGPKESLKSYYARSNFKKLLIDHLDQGVTFAAMARGVRPGTPLRFSLNKRPPENMSDLLDIVEKYLRAKEDSTSSHQEESHSGQKRRDRPEGKNQDEPKRPRAILPKPFTPLNTTREHILHQIKGQDILKWPKPMRGPVEKRDTQLYCHFHKDHGHTTEECKGPPKRAKAPASLEFNDLDLEGVSLPHDDAIVITIRIDVFQVKRILINTESSADILFEDAFFQMGISEYRVKPITSPLYGFIGRVAARCRFLSKSTERYLPFFKALKNIKNFEWKTECRASFDSLKEYLASPLLLSKLVPGEELFLYLAVAESAVSAVLVREEATRQLSIYQYIGKQFDNSTFRAFCSNLSIEQRFTSVAHPQTNGQTEVTNRTLLQGIKKKLDGVKGLWVDELPKILWAYNTTIRTPTGETPFSLLFGTEALIPVEIGFPSLRLTTYDPVQNVEALRANLDLLDERREQAAMCIAAYQHRVSKFYNQRVRPRMFQLGDLVMC